MNVRREKRSTKEGVAEKDVGPDKFDRNIERTP